MFLQNAIFVSVGVLFYLANISGQGWSITQRVLSDTAEFELVIEHKCSICTCEDLRGTWVIIWGMLNSKQGRGLVGVDQAAGAYFFWRFDLSICTSCDPPTPGVSRSPPVISQQKLHGQPARPPDILIEMCYFENM